MDPQFRAPFKAFSFCALVVLVLALAAYFKPYALTQGKEGAVTVSGFGNSGNSVILGTSALVRAARRLHEAGKAPAVDSVLVESILEGLLNKARAGEPEAAAFFLELAALQLQGQRAGSPTSTERE